MDVDIIFKDKISGNTVSQIWYIFGYATTYIIILQFGLMTVWQSMVERSREKNLPWYFRHIDLRYYLAVHVLVNMMYKHRKLKNERIVSEQKHQSPYSS